MDPEMIDRLDTIAESQRAIGSNESRASLVRMAVGAWLKDRGRQKTENMWEADVAEAKRKLAEAR